jgi:hypothetical protein
VIKRATLLIAIAACGLAVLSEPADARYGRRGWSGWGYPYGWGWGWYDWPTYYGDGPYGPGYYDRYAAYPLPQPVRPDPAYARLRTKCPAGRIPARWVRKVDKQGQVVMHHVMGRCR